MTIGVWIAVDVEKRFANRRLWLLRHKAETEPGPETLFGRIIKNGIASTIMVLCE